MKEENEKLKLINEERNGHLSLMINELEESKQLINQLNSEIGLIFEIIYIFVLH